MNETKALELAVLFHVIYERKSAEFDYATRTETRIFDPESPNGKLIIAVCEEILQDYISRDQAAAELAKLKEKAEIHDGERLDWKDTNEQLHHAAMTMMQDEATIAQLRAELDEARELMETVRANREWTKRRNKWLEAHPEEK